MKGNKGITLVALVITIIVLLILAGVSISMVVGENGVLNRATNASEKTSDADVETALKVAVSGLQGDFIGKWNENNTLSFLDCLTGKNCESGDKISLTSDGYDITVPTPETLDKYEEGKSRTIENCTIQKKNSKDEKIGPVYSFKLVEKSRYGADVQDFARKTE